MPTLREVAAALLGCYRLARLDVAGLAFFDRGGGAAIRSFAAALLVLPADIVLVLMRPQDDGASDVWLVILVSEVVTYIASWAAYLLIVHELSQLLDRKDRFPLFVSVYNWSSVLQMMLYLPAMLLGYSSLLPDPVSQFIVFVAVIIMFCYQWFVTRVALDVTDVTAAGLVLLDLLLSLFVSAAAGGIVEGMS